MKYATPAHQAQAVRARVQESAVSGFIANEVTEVAIRTWRAYVGLHGSASPQGAVFDVVFTYHASVALRRRPNR